MKRPYSGAYVLAFSQEHLWYEIWMFYVMFCDHLRRFDGSSHAYVMGQR